MINFSYPVLGGQDYAKVLESLYLPAVKGKIVQVIGLVIESAGPEASMGELCHVFDGDKNIGMAEVVGFREERTLLMPLSDIGEVRPGMDVVATHRKFTAHAGPELLGRVVDGLGKPIDGKGEIHTEERVDVYQTPPNPLDRPRIKEPLVTGVRAIDGFRTLGKGQRTGIFSGSGVGKSVLMGMIARHSEADVNVVALIGERGREVKEFLENDLGEEGLKKSIVVVATSDQPALVRMKAAFVATAFAEYFQNQGKNVLLMMDSSTRIALAQREIGLASGEPPTTKGYPPSVFAMLPKLFERAGMGVKGSITALYTVLVEGDDMDEPIADAVRSILDGHIVLSRELANRNHYPAIDVLKSVSRCMVEVISDEHKKIIQNLIRSMATYSKSEDMIQLGAYVKGSNKELDLAIHRYPLIEKFLNQEMGEVSSLEDALEKLESLQGVA